MTPGRLDIEVPRNGSDARIIQLLTHDENGDEVSVDLTDCSVSASARDVFGGTYIVAATCSIDDAAEGMVSLRWIGSAFDGFGDRFATAIAAWDLKVTDAGGIPNVPVRGLLFISPEATA